MFDIGFWELAFLFGLGLMVLGPERMPQVAAKLGRWAGQASNMARNLKNQMQEELEPVQSQVDSIQESVNKAMTETIGDSVDDPVNDSADNKPPPKDWSALRPEPGQSDANQADADKDS